MVASVLRGREVEGDLIVDVGCGKGNLYPYIQGRFNRYLGIDTVRYEELPNNVEFRHVDLNRETLPVPDGSADLVASVETIEHLENPRAYFRELVRIAKPGGVVIITTPNQLSLLSLMTLLLKSQFSAFQANNYPAHITALLEIDLRRIAKECQLINIEFAFSRRGRIVLTPWHFPLVLARLFPRLLSDNLLLIGTKNRV
jgi:SAM-dependent methyltransferase